MDDGHDDDGRGHQEQIEKLHTGWHCSTSSKCHDVLVRPQQVVERGTGGHLDCGGMHVKLKVVVRTAEWARVIWIDGRQDTDVRKAMRGSSRKPLLLLTLGRGGMVDHRVLR